MECVHEHISRIKTNALLDINYPGFTSSWKDDRFYFIYPLITDSDGLLLDGYKRLHRARQQRLDSLPVIRLGDAVDFEDTVRYRIATLNRGEDLDALQRVSLYIFIRERISDSNRKRLWQQELNLPGNPSMLEDLIRITEWSDNIKMYIHSHKMSTSQVSPFLSKVEEERGVLFTMAETLNIRPVELISVSKMITEIALNRGISVPELLKLNEIESIVFNEKWSRSQKLHHLKRALFRLRYPMISEYQNHLNKMTANLTFNSKMDLIYDRYFESGNVIIQLRISSIEDLSRSIRDLSSENNIKAMEDILETL